MKKIKRFSGNGSVYLLSAIMFTVVFVCLIVASGCTVKLVGTGEGVQDGGVPDETTVRPTTTTTTSKAVSTVDDLHGVWDGGMIISFDKSWSVMWTSQFVRTYHDNGNGTIAIRDASGSVSDIYGFDIDGDTLTLTDSSGAQCICKRVSESLICENADSAKGTWVYLTKGADGKQVWNVVSLEQPSSGLLQFLGTAAVGGNFASNTQITSYSLRYIGGVFRLRLDSCAVMTFDEKEGVMKPLSSPNNKDIESDFRMYKISPNTKLNGTQTNELLRELEKKLGLQA